MRVGSQSPVLAVDSWHPLIASLGNSKTVGSRLADDRVRAQTPNDTLGGVTAPEVASVLVAARVYNLLGPVPCCSVGGTAVGAAGEDVRAVGPVSSIAVVAGSLAEALLDFRWHCGLLVLGTSANGVRASR